MILKTLHKTAWFCVGCIFLALAIIGLLLPIVPQMPFFLASIFCFVRCSARFNNWLIQQPWYLRFHVWAQRQRWLQAIKNHLPRHQP